MNWSALEAAEVLARLDSDPAGLSGQEAERRRAEQGPNELERAAGPGLLRLLWAQLGSSLIALLLVAAALSLVLGETADAIAILVIVILNAALGFSQDLRAERAMAALERLAVPTVRVRRDGAVRELASTELVPGDVVLLEEGARVPADARVLQSVDLHAQEAALTGESEPVGKTAEVLPGGEEALGDRRNCLFMGTIVARGHGEAVVTETGMGTELGRIAGMLRDVKREPTPLQRRLTVFGRRLAIGAIGLVALVFAVGVVGGQDPELVLLTALSLAVAAVPEGLPAVATLCLALGGRRLLAREALIRKLPAVESLGSVTVICSDKTGTLTQNRMAVTVLDVAGDRLELPDAASALPAGRGGLALAEEQPSLALLVAAAALCNDALLDEGGGDEAIGDPTEAAFVLAARSLGFSKPELERRYPRVGELAFDSERKRMTTVHRLGGEGPLEAVLGPAAGGRIALEKGGVESVLDSCTAAWTGAGVEPLDDGLRERIDEAHEELAAAGLRVLGFAFRVLDDGVPDEELETELVFVGMMGLMDPPRPEVREAVERCRAAGIRPVMITGDHPLTARVVAERVGIDASAGVATGPELARATDEELDELCERVAVHARVAPEHKLRIVEALRRRGQVVAMTGDGVNDAPALKKADVGVAMGVTGTDVSKEAGDVVLLDDNFATIVNAVEEGRVIHDNIAKFIRYTLTSNAGEIWVMLLGPFFGLPLALLPLQVLWINLVTDGLPGLALAMEPAEKGVMSRPPRPMSEAFLTRGLLTQVLWVSLLMAAVSLGVGIFQAAAGADEAHWRTLVFTVLTFSQLGNVLAMRSTRDSLFRIGLFSNPFLLGSVVLTVGLQLVLIYWPPLQQLFRLAPLPAADLALACLLSTAVFAAVELAKWRERQIGT